MRFPIFTVCSLAVLAALPLAAAPAPPSSAALPPDVPSGHWAAGSVNRVVHQKIMGRDPDGRFRGNKIVTRYELAVALDRFVQYMEAAHKPLHATIVQPHPVVSPKATPAARRALENLISSGFLPPTSPLVTHDGRQPATAQELADALSAVTIRLSDRAEPPQKE